MRTTSLKTIYLTIPELREAVANYIRDAQDVHLESLYLHMINPNNEWAMEWATRGEEFAISIDGEVKDEIRDA